MALPPVFIEFLGKSTGFMATSKGVRSELKAVERDGGGSMAKLGAVSKAALMGVGVAAGVAAVKTVKMAADFQTQMTRVQTGAGELKQNMGMVSQGILSMAGQVGQSTTDLTSGLYMVESAGFHGSNALNVLKVAAMGAKVGAADLSTVTDAVTTAMNAYNLQSTNVAKNTQNATDVMNALVGTEAEGKTNMEALAGSMASILPVASAAHVGLNEILGAMATMTSQGTSADVAATYLRQTIGQLSNPSAKAAATMKGLGLSATDVSQELGSKGLAATLTTLTDAIKNKMGPSGTVLIQTLQKASKSGTDFQAALNKASGSQKTYIGALATMVGGTKSMMGALQLTGSHMQTFKDNVAGIAEHVKKGGKNIEGWADVQKTFNQRMAEAKGSIQAVAISIGNVLLPYATKMVGWLSTSVTWLTQHKTAVLVLAGAIGGVLVVGLAAAAAAAWSFTAAILANPVTWIVIGIMALVAGLVLLAMHWKQAFAWISTNMPGVISFFKSAWQIALKWFGQIWDQTMKLVHSVVVWFDNNVLKWVQARVADFTKWWASNGAEVSKVWSLLWSGIQAVAKIAWDVLSVGFTLVGAILKTVWDLIVNAVKGAWSIISSAVTLGMHLILNIVSILSDILTGHWSKLWHDLIHFVEQTFSDLWNFLGSVVSTIWNLLTGVGSDIINGIVSGLESAGHAIKDMLVSLAKGALNVVKSVLGINSPSRVFRDEVGVWIPHGIAEGIRNTSHVVHGTLGDLADGAVKTFSDKLGIASPSKVFRQLGMWVNLGLVSGLTGSQAQVKSAITRTEKTLMSTYNAIADLAGKRHGGASGSWIRSHEATVKRLEAYVGKEGAALNRLAAQRQSVADRLKAAQTNLANLQKDWAKEQANVAQGIMQGASVVLSNQNGPVSAQDVVENMQQQTQQALQFAGNLDRLKKMGLSSDLIAQIAQSGVASGGATAAALAQSNVDQIRQLNAMQKTLGNAANNTGATVADSMYGAGIDSAKGLIKGLQSQEAAIQKQMLKIAEQMKNAIKKALGIHSPSRVFAEIGTFITAGLQNGVESTAHGPIGSVTNLSNAIAKAGQPKLSGTAVGASGGGTHVHNHLHIEVHGTVRSDRELRDLFQQEMLRLGGRNPTTWQPYRR